MKEIPILLYHNVGNYPESMMIDGITVETFRKQMLFLEKNEYHIVSLRQAINHLQGDLKLPPNAISITVDGGYLDAYTNVFPILKENKIPAAFFISPEFIGKGCSVNGNPIDCLTWDHVREIREHGIDIGLLAYAGKGISPILRI